MPADSLVAYLAAAAAPQPGHRPWPRFALDEAAWLALREQLAQADWSLVGLWGDGETVHAALRDEVDGAIAVASLAVAGGRYPSLAAVRPAAQRLERALRDLHGIVPDGLPDARPWLDHGAWPVAKPLASAPAPRDQRDQHAPYEFLAAEGDSLHQIAVGPVHAGIIEPGHFRFHANGETVARLEQRLGYVHKGIEKLMQGRDVAAAARLASRLSGDSVVAHSWAFAQAVEAALDVAPPPRAAWLRAVMAELERVANHLGDVGAIANDATFTILHAHCAMLREHTLRAADAAFGHRLMMDRVIPGGVAADLSPAGKEIIGEVIEAIAPRFAALTRIYDNAASLADRTVGTGVVPAQLVHRFGAGGYVGRASGRPLDARLSPGYAPYDKLEFEVPTHTDGDVNARVWIRIREVEASLGLLRQLLDRLPDGDIAISLPARGGEGMALIEGFRGEIMTWVRLDGAGRVARCHPRDPSWFQWPLLEAAIENNIVADFPLCNKSFNCSYAGHDL
jgi:Ni,Fe-hydrogenase III large subunit